MVDFLTIGVRKYGVELHPSIIYHSMEGHNGHTEVASEEKVKVAQVSKERYRSKQNYMKDKERRVYV